MNTDFEYFVLFILGLDSELQIGGGGRVEALCLAVDALPKLCLVLPQPIRELSTSLILQ